MSPVYSSIRDLLSSLFGVYTPISYTDSSGVSVVPAGLAGVNMEYVASVFLFALVLWCLFRLLGLFFQRH